MWSVTFCHMTRLTDPAKADDISIISRKSICCNIKTQNIPYTLSYAGTLATYNTPLSSSILVWPGLAILALCPCRIAGFSARCLLVFRVFLFLGDSTAVLAVWLNLLVLGVALIERTVIGNHKIKLETTLNTKVWTVPWLYNYILLDC